MNVKIEDSWRKALAAEWDKDYFTRLVQFVKHEYATATVFPPGGEIFAAFDATPFDRVKVVILGQDPYHDVNQANGLCFSVRDGVPFRRRRPHPLGASGGASAQLHPHRACPQCRLSPESRLGTVYR